MQLSLRVRRAILRVVGGVHLEVTVVHVREWERISEASEFGGGQLECRIEVTQLWWYRGVNVE